MCIMHPGILHHRDPMTYSFRFQRMKKKEAKIHKNANDMCVRQTNNNNLMRCIDG